MSASRRLPVKQVGAEHSRFQTTFQSASVGIGICSLVGVILEVNTEFEKTLGFSGEDLINANILRLDPIYCTLRRPTKTERLANGLAEGVGAVELTNDGLAGVGSHDVNSPDNHLQDEFLLGELLRGERPSIVSEKRYHRKNGSELWGRLTVSLGRNLQGEPAFLIALLSDASERKKVEEHLHEAEQMEVIGRLAGGIVHDFNNLLTGILLYCDLLRFGLDNNSMNQVPLVAEPWQPEAALGREPVQETGELSKHVEEMRLASEQGAALTQQLLAIARRRTIESIPIVLNDVVTSTKNLLGRLIGEKIELVTDLDPDCGTVLADPGQLRQILLNVVLNARDAMPLGGTITVSTKVAIYRAKDSAAAEDLRPAVALLVKDNGSGMDAATQSRIFEPLFTTKKCGTGFGLMTVQRIVRETGGDIKVISEPDCGTTVEMVFPTFVTPAETSAKKNTLSTLVSAQPAAIASELFVASAVSPRKPSSRKVLPVTPLCSSNAAPGDNRKTVTQHLKTRGDQHV